MTIQIQLFARARDLAGSDCIQLDLEPPVAVSELRSRLLEEYPALHPLAASLLVAVNNEYARDESVIPEGAELACFPPVSGG